MKKCTRGLSQLPVVIICFSFLISSVGANTPKTLNQHSEEPITLLPSNDPLLVVYEFPQPVVKEYVVGTTTYHIVELADAPNGGDLGQPSLPFKDIQILLPYGTTIRDITVTPGERHELGSHYTILPAQQPIPCSQEEPSPSIIRNEETYRSAEPYPNTLFTSAGIDEFRGYQLLSGFIYPVQYTPSTGELSYYSTMTVSISTEPRATSTTPLYRGLPKDKQTVQEKVDNPGSADTYALDDTERDPAYDLLILTTNALQRGFQPLIDAHNRNGTKTLLTTLEEIGSTDPEAIRTYIRDAYLNLGIEYVLLGGDNDTLPARFLYFGNYEGRDYIGPSDLYYACLNGTYNYDEDEWWGEPTDGDNGDDVDLVAEVYVGRACVDTLEEVGCFVNKTIAYMNVGDKGYLRNVLLAGTYLSGPLEGKPLTFGDEYLEQLINFSDVDGYDTVGIPNDMFSLYRFDRLYDHLWPGFNLSFPWTTGWPKEELINRLNNGVHLLNNVGHAGDGFNMKLEIVDVDSLTNDDLFFAYSQGCDAGAFDQDAYQHVDCIAEHFTIKTNHAAFAGIWNARFGFYTPGHTSSDSQRFHRYFWDAVFNESTKVISKANQDSKEEQLAFIHIFPYMRWICYGLNLFGDPTISFKELEAKHNIGVASIDIAEQVKARDIKYVNTTIYNSGRENETNITVKFFADSTFVSAQMIPRLDSHTATTVCFAWATPSARQSQLTMAVSLPGKEEQYLFDNTENRTVLVGVQNQNTGELFTTIQEALNSLHTQHGHRIFVPEGVYQENILITKDVSLIGEYAETTILKSVGSQGIVRIRNTHQVNLTDFTIMKGIQSFGTKNTYGIIIETSDHTTLQHLTISSNFYEGILVKASHDVLLSNNEISSLTWGIHLTDLSHDITIIQNTFHDNGNQQSGGGILFENTQRNLVKDNDLLRNTVGIKIDARSIGNLIAPNTFDNINNAYDAGTNNVWNYPYTGDYGTDPCGGNFWADYQGIDEYSGPEQDIPGPDGIGDTPYNIPGGQSQDQYPLMHLAGVLVINDNTGEGFPTIQAAIDDPDTLDGHLLRVSTGIYGHITITKSLHIIGLNKNNTIIDGQGWGNWSLVEILASNVTLNGFTVRNSGGAEGIFGIDVWGNHTSLSDNIITNNCVGVNLVSYEADNTTITNNIISDNTQQGLLMFEVSYNLVTNNTVTGNGQQGIYIGSCMVNVRNNTIADNIISHNGEEGIILEGLYFVVIHNTIMRNRIMENRMGITLSMHTNLNTLTDNTVRDNTYNGITIHYRYAAPNNNIIYHNNFVSNTPNVLVDYYQDYNIWNREYPLGGNYWSDYQGQDHFSGPGQNITGPDGIGDTRYFIAPYKYDSYPFMQENGWYV